MRVTAGWCTVNSNGGSNIPSQKVKEGMKAAVPKDPSREGYVFAGWYTDNGYTTSFNFDNPIMSTTVIYAKWDAEAPQPGHNDVTYIAKGDKEVKWVKGSNKNATLAFMAEKNDENNNTFRKFQKVMIDGHEVDAKNYSAKEGSVLISFNANYLDTLEVGDHKVQAVFTDGVSKESILKVAAMPGSNDNGNTTAQGAATSNKDGNISKTGGKTTISNGVRTGDESNMLGYLIMLLAASGVGTGIYRKKNQ